MNTAFMAQPEEAMENETPTDSPTESNEEGIDPSQEGDEGEETGNGIETPINTPDADHNIPFHKHPRWIARQREMDELRRTIEELKTAPREPEVPASQPQTQEMPDWWKETFGTDEASQTAFQKQLQHEQQMYEKWKANVINEFRSSEEQARRAHEESVRKYEQEIEDNILALQEAGHTFDRNELLKVVEEFSVDGQGNFIGQLFPFDKALQILQTRKAAPTPTDTARKQAASLSAKGTKSGTTAKTMPTLSDIRNRGWGSWRSDTD